MLIDGDAPIMFLEPCGQFFGFAAKDRNLFRGINYGYKFLRHSGQIIECA